MKLSKSQVQDGVAQRLGQDWRWGGGLVSLGLGLKPAGLKLVLGGQVVHCSKPRP